jgi:predicted transcriptional regulator
MTTIIERTQPVIEQVPLSELTSLAETTFHFPEHAMRAVDFDHVYNLMESDPALWPNIKVVDTDDGAVVIDGYHRWKALENIIILNIIDPKWKGNGETPGLKKNEIEKKLYQPRSDTVELAIKHALDRETIAAEVGVYASEKDIAKAALTANLKHGKAPDSKARVHIAYDYFLITRDENPQPSQAEIARMVGISRAALNEHIKKQEKKAELEAKIAEKSTTAEDAAGLEEEPLDQDQKEAAEYREKVLKKAYKFNEELKKAEGDNLAVAVEMVETILCSAVIIMNDYFSDKGIEAYGDSIRYAMGIKVEDNNPGNMMYLLSVAKAFEQAHKKSSHKYKK